LFEASREERFLDQASELVALFRRRFFDGRTLGEYFAADWSRDAGALEPGHHFEWAWILAQYQRFSGDNVEQEAAALVDFAEAHGVDAALGMAFDTFDASGAPLQRTSRAWPNTERIKGHLALFELTGRDPRPAVASASRLLLDRYLLPYGAWIDRLNEQGEPAPGPAPASTFYHVFLAFAEVLRLEPVLRAQTP
jgi:mannose/cellobiose epimerase-like protein (N-acyl-D-glucosamine 2-epimerase family)